MSGTLFQLKDLDRLRFLLDLPQLSYFPSTFIYGALDTARTRLDFITYPENLSPKEALLSNPAHYSSSKHIEKSIGLFLSKEAARAHYHLIAQWSRETKRHLVLLEYKNDKLISLLCVSPIKPELRQSITQALEALRQRYWLEETAPKPKLVLPEINAQEFNKNEHYLETQHIENMERSDPHQKKVKAYQHKI